MSEDTKPRGRAVAEKATIQFLTLPDGSKRRVASRPKGEPELIYNWLIEEFGENPKRWLDFRDLYRFLYGGEPMRINREVRRTLRNFIRGARRYAIERNDLISVKLDSKNGVTQFKIWNRESTAETKASMENASKDLGVEDAWERRVDRQCNTLQTDRDQLQAILNVLRAQRFAAKQREQQVSFPEEGSGGPVSEVQ